jgi:hypothetical protein
MRAEPRRSRARAVAGLGTTAAIDRDRIAESLIGEAVTSNGSLQMSKTTMSALVLAATLALGASRAQAQVPPEQVSRTFEAIQENGKMVMAWVYPTVSFTDVGPCNWATADGGFILACRFDYIDDGDRDARLLRFRLDRRGFVRAIEDGGGDSFVPPFTFLRVTKGLMSHMAKDELAKLPEGDDDRRALLELVAQSPDPSQILAALLNIRIVLGR